MTENRFINPVDIPDQDLPLIVLSDFSSGIIQSLIKIRTNSEFSHIMVMNREGFFASQGNMFSEAPLTRYMKTGNRLKFFKIKNLTEEERFILSKKMEDDLTAPWWKRLYDYPGILGQAFNIRWFNSPFRAYCSERVAAWLRVLPRFNKIPVHPSPQDLNELMKADEINFELYGVWDYDLTSNLEVHNEVSGYHVGLSFI
jgi:hypothetical protein